MAMNTNHKTHEFWAGRERRQKELKEKRLGGGEGKRASGKGAGGSTEVERRVENRMEIYHT